MVVKSIIDDMLPNIWPLVLFISVVAITLRCAYLFRGSKKFVLHKELLSLVFIIYILCLYYVLTYQDINYGGVNLIPFKEMTRYEIGSYKFMKNIVGNILLFVPFGFFASYYLNNKKASVITIVTLIVSGCAEGMQYYLGRVFDIDDVILNVLGGLIGFILYQEKKGDEMKTFTSGWVKGFLTSFVLAVAAGVIYYFAILSILK